MPKILENIFKWLFAAWDLLTIILFIGSQNGWTMNEILCNQYFKMLIVATVFTTVIFLIRPIHSYFKNSRGRIGEILSFSIIGLIVILILYTLPTIKCSDKKNKEADVSVAKTDSTLIKLNKPDTVFITSVKNTPIIITKPKPIINKRPQQQTSADTSKLKFDLSNATFNAPTQVGDNNVQNIDTEVKFGQNDLNLIFKKVVFELQQKFGLKDHVTIYMTGGGNRSIYGQLMEFFSTKKFIISTGEFYPNRHMDVLYIYPNRRDSSIGIVVGAIKTIPITIETP